MKRSMYTICTPVEGALYRDLLAFVSDQGYLGMLIEPPYPLLSENARAVLNKLHPYERIRATSWPGTTLLQEEATVNKFLLTRGAVDVLTDATPSLLGWVAPELPEDLCVLRPDETPWLVTIAHEGDAYLELADDEAPMLAKLEGLQIKRDEPVWS